MIEKGADVVVCQHSHCVGCEENYLGGTIVYGQGNFIFDYRNDVEWQTGLLTVIELFENNEFKVSYCAVEKQENKVRISDGVKTIEEFNNRSQQIKEESFVAASFEKEAKKVLGTKLAMLLGGFSSSFFYKLFNKISKKLSK